MEDSLSVKGPFLDVGARLGAEYEACHTTLRTPNLSERRSSMKRA